MGYYVETISGAGLRIEAAKVGDALNAVVTKLTEWNESKPDWAQTYVPHSIEGLLDTGLGFGEVVTDPENVSACFQGYALEANVGDIVFPWFSEKWRNNSLLLNALAPYFTDDSELVFLGEDGAIWRVSQAGEENGTLSFVPAQEERG